MIFLILVREVECWTYQHSCQPPGGFLPVSFGSDSFYPFWNGNSCKGIAGQQWPIFVLPFSALLLALITFSGAFFSLISPLTSSNLCEATPEDPFQCLDQQLSWGQVFQQHLPVPRCTQEDINRKITFTCARALPKSPNPWVSCDCRRLLEFPTFCHISPRFVWCGAAWMIMIHLFISGGSEKDDLRVKNVPAEMRFEHSNFLKFRILGFKPQAAGP